MNWVLALSAFIATAVADLFWVRWQRAITVHHAHRAAMWSVGVFALGSAFTLTVVEKDWEAYLAALCGAYVGTWTAARKISYRERRHVVSLRRRLFRCAAKLQFVKTAGKFVCAHCAPTQLLSRLATWTTTVGSATNATNMPTTVSSQGRLSSLWEHCSFGCVLHTKRRHVMPFNRNCECHQSNV